MSQLYDHYVERVHALITMRLRLRGDTDTSRAWDLTRQTFVALWRTALTRPPDATPNEWVLGTAQSVSDEAGEHAVGGV